MNKIITTSLLGLLLGTGLSASATTNVFDSGSISELIPDNNLLGTGNDLTYTLSGAETFIGDVSLTFELQNGYSGDLSGYLRLGNTISSPYYDLTSLIQSLTLGAAPESYTIDFTTPAFSSTFSGQNPNNTWTLFIADTAAGDETVVKNWALTIVTVPEPTSLAVLIFGAGLTAFYRRWRTGMRPGMRRWHLE
jgi:subtilisin-like proprotein convertase family protein